MRIIFETENPALIKSVNDFVQEWESNSTHIKVSTSGSTGKPKEILIEKTRMIESARMTGNYLELKQGDTALLCLNIDTIAGKMMIVRSIVLDMTLVVVDVESNPLRELNHNINFAAMVPLQAETSLKESKEKFSSIVKLIIGGGTISSRLEEQIAKSKGKVFQTFGMTETISHVAMRLVGGENLTYTALPNIEFSEEEGALVINAPTLGVKDLKTNDLVTLIDKYQFQWLGRKDFVINSGGVKIYPEIIEHKLSQSFKESFFIYGLDDDFLGSKLVMCIESSHPIEFTKDSFLALSNKYHVPKEVYVFQSFHYNSSGKLNRKETINKLSNAQKQIL